AFPLRPVDGPGVESADSAVDPEFVLHHDHPRIRADALVAHGKFGGIAVWRRLDWHATTVAQDLRNQGIESRRQGLAATRSLQSGAMSCRLPTNKCAGWTSQRSASGSVSIYRRLPKEYRRRSSTCSDRR